MSSNICEKYFYFFHLLGVGYYNPRENLESGCCAQLRKSVPTICLLLFAFLNSVLSFHEFRVRSSLTNFLYTVFVIVKFSTMLVAFKRSSFLRRDTKFVWKYLLTLEVFLRNRLKLEINFGKCVKRYNGKLRCMAVFFGIWMAVKALYRIDATNVVRQLAIANLTFISWGITCHVILYIDLFSFFMETINRHTLKFIETDPANSCIINDKPLNLNEKITHLFQMLKFIHFKLWKIVKILNNDLGSVLTVLVINSAYTSVLTFYWIVIELDNDGWFLRLHIISMFEIQKLLFIVINSGKKINFNSSNISA